MINWIWFPKSDEATELARKVVQVFENAADEIDSTTHPKQESDEVLAKLAKGLSDSGFAVETGKKRNEKIRVPVLFGMNGRPEKSFDADAYHRQEGFVVEVEAGRGYTNYHFLKDLFEACMMHGVTCLAVAVRNDYRGNADFEKVVKFMDTLYASNRLNLPLKGLLIIGY